MMVNEVVCPDCGAPMVLRTARKGRYAGQEFYGYSDYPRCKTIFSLEEADHTSSIQRSRRGTPQQAQETL